MNLVHFLTLWLICQFMTVSYRPYVPIKGSYSRQQQSVRQFVRVTVYHSNEDSFTRKLQSASGRPLLAGQTCAVDPKLFPYGTKIRVEGWGILTAVDTGKAVKSKKASRGKLPIIDVFFKDEKSAMAAVRSRPEICLITVLN